MLCPPRTKMSTLCSFAAGCDATSCYVKQGSNGGALEVKHGGEAVFLVPVHFAANAVADGYSGGALHVEGEVYMHYFGVGMIIDAWF